MNNKYFKVTISFGILLAITNILIAQILKYLGLSPFSSINYVTFIPVIILLYLSIKTYSKTLKKTISFKNAISISLLTNIISSLIISIFTYIYFTAYDNELNDIKNHTYQEYIKRNTEEPSTDNNREIYEYLNTNYTPYKLAVSNFTLGIFLSMILSIAVSIVYKKINNKINV